MNAHRVNGVRGGFFCVSVNTYFIEHFCSCFLIFNVFRSQINRRLRDLYRKMSERIKSLSELKSASSQPKPIIHAIEDNKEGAASCWNNVRWEMAQHIKTLNERRERWYTYVRRLIGRARSRKKHKNGTEENVVNRGREAYFRVFSHWCWKWFNLQYCATFWYKYHCKTLKMCQCYYGTRRYKPRQIWSKNGSHEDWPCRPLSQRSSLSFSLFPDCLAFFPMVSLGPGPIVQQRDLTWISNPHQSMVQNSMHLGKTQG